tara:strand:+ start:296 stop:568 length:273 start_codon:yes stop_codon:yes gene_type:complete
MSHLLQSSVYVSDQTSDDVLLSNPSMSQLVLAYPIAMALSLVHQYPVSPKHSPLYLSSYSAHPLVMHDATNLACHPLQQMVPDSTTALSL